MNKYVLDTNIFNWILDGRIGTGDLPSDGLFFATPLQSADISVTADDERRRLLLSKLEEIAPSVLHAESFMFGVEGAGFDQAKWSDGQTYPALMALLDARRLRPSNVQDALIAEVAFKNGMSLITADKILSEVAEGFGISVVFFSPDYVGVPNTQES